MTKKKIISSKPNVTRQAVKGVAVKELKEENNKLKSGQITLLQAIDGLIGREMRDCKAYYDKPIIGNFVIEMTNPFAPYLIRFGEVMEIDNENKDYPRYKIKLLDGSIQEWYNCLMMVIPLRYSGKKK